MKGSGVKNASKLRDRPKRAGPSLSLLCFGALLLIVNRLSGLVLPYSNRFFVDRVLIAHQLRSLGRILIVVLAAIVVQAGTTYLLNRFIARESLRLIAGLRVKVRDHLLQVPMRFYDHHQTGELVSRVMRDLDGIRALFGTGMIELLGGVLNSLFAIGIMFSLDLQLTIWIILALLGFVGFLAIILPPLRKAYRDQAVISGEISGQLSESISGIHTVKVYCGERHEAQQFRHGVEKLLATGLRGVMYSERLSVSVGLLLGVANCGVMYMVARQVLSAHMSVGTFVSYTLFVGMMSAPILQVAGMGAQFGEALAGFKRAKEILAEREDESTSPRLRSCPRLDGHVQFVNVSFGYNKEVTVLNDVSFESSPGSVTAIVGASGAGKSTIMTLLAGFERPLRGQIRVDGIELELLNMQSYRRQLAIVLQDTFLFDGTLRDNILYGKPNASEDELHSAARKAFVDEFAETLPDGYATRVGERGVRLSGGQKQRVAIARALLVNPRILLLDEATSNLDAEAEAVVQQSLATLFAERTVFLVAHRLTTVQRADQILVLEKGRIAERGRHEELLHLKGKYSALYGSQMHGGFSALREYA